LDAYSERPLDAIQNGHFGHFGHFGWLVGWLAGWLID
jgi:hypothetical protein